MQNLHPFIEEMIISKLGQREMSPPGGQKYVVH